MAETASAEPVNFMNNIMKQSIEIDKNVSIDKICQIHVQNLKKNMYRCRSEVGQKTCPRLRWSVRARGPIEQNAF